MFTDWESAIWLSFVLMTGIVGVLLALGGALVAGWLVLEKLRTWRNLPPTSSSSRRWTVLPAFGRVQSPIHQDEPAAEDEYTQEALPF